MLALFLNLPDTKLSLLLYSIFFLAINTIAIYSQNYYLALVMALDIAGLLIYVIEQAHIQYFRAKLKVLITGVVLLLGVSIPLLSYLVPNASIYYFSTLFLAGMAIVYIVSIIKQKIAIFLLLAFIIVRTCILLNYDWVAVFVCTYLFLLYVLYNSINYLGYFEKHYLIILLWILGVHLVVSFLLYYLFILDFLFFYTAIMLIVVMAFRFLWLLEQKRRQVCPTCWGTCVVPGGNHRIRHWWAVGSNKGSAYNNPCPACRGKGYQYKYDNILKNPEVI